MNLGAQKTLMIDSIQNQHMKTNSFIFCVVIQLQLRYWCNHFVNKYLTGLLSALKSLAPWFIILGCIHYKLMLPEHFNNIKELPMNTKKFMLRFKEAASKIIKLRQYSFSKNLTKYMGRKIYKLKEDFCLLDSTNFKQEGFCLWN